MTLTPDEGVRLRTKKEPKLKTLTLLPKLLRYLSSSEVGKFLIASTDEMRKSEPELSEERTVHFLI